MSGFEIAGVVLGALPLIIEAFKTAKEVKSAFNKFSKKDQHVKRYITKLSWHRISLGASIQKIASHACIQNVTDQMVESGEAVAILNANYDVLVEKVGRHRCHALIENVTDAASTYKELILKFDGLFPHDLALMRDDPHLLQHLINMNDFDAQKFWRQKRQRLSFLNRRSEIVEDIKILDELIDTIAKLATLSTESQNFGIATQSQSQSSSKKMSQLDSLERLHKAASRLLAAITAAIPGLCRSHHRHSVRLFLEPHTDRQRFGVDDAKSPNFYLEVLGYGNGQAQVVHHRGRIAVHQDDEHMPSSVTDPKNPSKQVRFTVSAQEPPKSTLQVVQTQEITTFCTSVLTTSVGDIHVSHLGTLRCRHVCTSATAFHGKEQVTLAEVLPKVSILNTQESMWTVLQRSNFAFVLASTVLQLCCAGWLPSQLDARSIYFYKQSNVGSRLPPFDTVRPFFENTDPPGLHQPSLSTATQWTLDLAIMLLELWDGKVFSEWLTTRGIENTCANHTTRHKAAQAWYTEMYPRILPDYNLAIERCLGFAGCEMDMHDWTLERFRERFCTEIVQVLGDFATGKSRE